MQLGSVTVRFAEARLESRKASSAFVTPSLELAKAHVVNPSPIAELASAPFALSSVSVAFAKDGAPNGRDASENGTLTDLSFARTIPAMHH